MPEMSWMLAPISPALLRSTLPEISGLPGMSELSRSRMPGRSLTSLITESVARVSVSRSGPAMKYCTLALDMPVLNGGTESTVMRHSTGNLGTISCRTRSMSVC